MAQGTLAPTLPSEAEAILAKETSRVLASRVQTAEPLRLRILDDPAKGTLQHSGLCCANAHSHS